MSGEIAEIRRGAEDPFSGQTLEFDPAAGIAPFQRQQHIANHHAIGQNPRDIFLGQRLLGGKQQRLGDPHGATQRLCLASVADQFLHAGGENGKRRTHAATPVSAAFLRTNNGAKA